MKIFPFLLKSFLFWGNHCRPISIVDTVRSAIYETVVHGAQEVSDGQKRYIQTRRIESNPTRPGRATPVLTSHRRGGTSAAMCPSPARRRVAVVEAPILLIMSSVFELTLFSR